MTATPRNRDQNHDNATMLDAVLLELSINLKAKLTELNNDVVWLNNCYTAAEKMAKTIDNKTIYYPAVYVGKGEYLNLMPDGHLGSYSFFRIHDPEEVEFYARNVNKITAKFDLIIWFNLEKLFPGDTGRNVEHVKERFLKAFRQILTTKGTYIIDEIYKDAKNIFSSYTIQDKDEKFMTQPYGALMIRGKVIYKENC